MKKVFFVFALMFFAFSVSAQQNKVEENRELKEEAVKIGKELSLNATEEHMVYNVLCHVKTRIADIPVGHRNYAKLAGYIDEERISMMKAILSIQKYKQYDNVFGPAERQKIKKLIEQNNEYVKTNGELSDIVTGADIVDDQFFDTGEENPDSPENGDANVTDSNSGDTKKDE